MSTTDWDQYDAVLAASVFGLSEREAIIERLEAWLVKSCRVGARVGSLEISVGAGVEICLPDGSRQFAKLWPPKVDPVRLRAQLELQDELARRGYPAPRIRSDLESVSGAWAIIMDWDRAGEPTDVRKPGVLDAMAVGLFGLVSAAQASTISHRLPRHELPELWPTPHNQLFNFENTATGAEWIDRVAQEALAVLRTHVGAKVPGHLDWSAKNMRMADRTISVVYDWDAMHLADECFIVGSAAASFPTTWELPVDPIPSPQATSQFVEAYELARGALFDAQQRARIAAATTYSLAYTARCNHAVNPEEAKARWSTVLSS